MTKQWNDGPPPSGRKLTWPQTERWREFSYQPMADGGKPLFMVEIDHWTLGDWDGYSRRGNNHWNVYAYIYPAHSLFAKVIGEDARHSEEVGALPLHGGVTLFEVHHAADGSIQSVQIGCDYGHYMDDEYSRMSTRDEASWVFGDAERLHAHLLALIDSQPLHLAAEE